MTQIQFICVLAIVLVGIRPACSQDNAIPLGVAKVDVTPQAPVVLAGYGGRTRPFEAIQTKLWARAMVIGRSEPLAIVVLDNCGITKEITQQVRTRMLRHGFRAENITVAATHTHNAPNLEGYAPILWQGRMDDAQIKASKHYTDRVVEKLCQSILKAQENVAPMKLYWAQGRVTFGGNRRVISNGQWGGFGLQHDAPVDHSLPVLVAQDSLGKIKAIWANYACHCTTAGSSNTVNGDWAGFANESMEKAFPEAIALMSIGCGADVGPQPSGSLELAKKHGASIAAEVNRLIAEDRLNVLDRKPVVRTQTIQLALEKPKPKSYWESLAKTRGFEQQLARKMLFEIETLGRIPDVVDYPITTWTFGKQLAIVFMPGEVVVDYAVRLKSELDWERLWITAWSNRMPGYIPSKKVLAEGGYEADFSQVYYGLPGRYQPVIEGQIVKAVRLLAGREFLAKKDADPSPYHKLPSQESRTLAKFVSDVRMENTSYTREFLNRVRSVIPLARPAVGNIDSRFGQQTNWFNLYGDPVSRIFMRQEKGGERIEWNLSLNAGDRADVLCFTGGLGWKSQPKSAGFILELSTGERVHLDVTQDPTTWKSERGNLELLYLPIWKSNEDSAGFFFLISKVSFPEEETIKFTMRSEGKGSLRWFGLDQKQKIRTDLKKLAKLLTPLKPSN
ncbi:MAG: neutral/alkaline non-lysosomal ceramidase N-terminal domain-containing protein [Planctomycetota bacterium]|nr:neutral/alkaline non-lysosomal ceramidase N-terminal domain-containing protein [Planctomycetota bacterium]